MANDYIYAVARVRGKELQLLPGSFIESLASAKSYEEALRLLADHGWGDGKEEPKEILRGERDKTWETICPSSMSSSMQTIITTSRRQ